MSSSLVFILPPIPTVRVAPSANVTLKRARFNMADFHIGVKLIFAIQTVASANWAFHQRDLVQVGLQFQFGQRIGAVNFICHLIPQKVFRCDQIHKKETQGQKHPLDYPHTGHVNSVEDVHQHFGQEGGHCISVEIKHFEPLKIDDPKVAFKMG